MKPTLGALLALGLASSLSGCGTFGECTRHLAPAVELTIVDESGAPALIDVLTYQVDDRAPVSADCSTRPGVDWCDGTGAATTYYLGAEDPGRYVIEATGPSGTGRVEVEVGSDACHVETELVTLVLR